MGNKLSGDAFLGEGCCSDGRLFYWGKERLRIHIFVLVESVNYVSG